MFYEFLYSEDFVGADMAKKFLHMGFTRSRRYANHRDGKKWSKQGSKWEVLPQERDAMTCDKAKSAEIFKAAWTEARENKKYLQMKTTALIPARLESKRFPNKLIKKINGTPIILKTYRSAIDTGLFDNVYVVSGDDKILELIKTEGGKSFKSIKNHNSGTDSIAEAVI